MKSKTVIISSPNEKENGRGILSILQEEGLLKFRLRLYNTPKLSRYCRLGIYHQKQVYSANLLEKNGVYESSMVGDFDMDQDFYSAIIDTYNKNNVILAGGTYAGYFFNDYSVFNQDSINEKDVFKNIEKENPDTNIYKHNEIDLDCENNCDKCANCKYKEYFYSNHEEIKINENKQTNTEINEEIKTPTSKDTSSIIQAIIPQFKYIFENYQLNETLTNLIPSSKFVTINENNEEYSIGAIYNENEELKYICYALFCNYNTTPPQELGEHYQWLPLDKEDPLSDGYYLVFQDANDLKILEL